MPRDASFDGSAFIRTARGVPYTCTRLTPGTMLSRCPACVVAYSYNCARVTELLYIAMYLIGWSFGFVLLSVGGLGRSGGSCPDACVSADCTSVAAASMLLFRSNCSVKFEFPWLELLVTISSPGICM